MPVKLFGVKKCIEQPPNKNIEKQLFLAENQTVDLSSIPIGIKSMAIEGYDSNVINGELSRFPNLVYLKISKCDVSNISMVSDSLKTLLLVNCKIKDNNFNYFLPELLNYSYENGSVDSPLFSVAYSKQFKKLNFEHIQGTITQLPETEEMSFYRATFGTQLFSTTCKDIYMGGCFFPNVNELNVNMPEVRQFCFAVSCIDNKIETLNLNIPNVRVLSLMGNPFSFRTINGITNRYLENLAIKNCLWQNWPINFYESRNIVEVDIANCRIEGIPDTVMTCPRLRIFITSGNPLGGEGGQLGVGMSDRLRNWVDNLTNHNYKNMGTDFFSNSQNVHDASMHNKVIRSIHHVLNTVPNKHPDPISFVMNKSDDIITPQAKRIFMTGCRSCGNLTRNNKDGLNFDTSYVNLASCIFGYVVNEKNDFMDLFLECLNSELISAGTTCVVGQYSRLINSLSGVHPEVVIDLDPIQYRGTFINNTLKKKELNNREKMLAIEKYMSEENPAPPNAIIYSNLKAVAETFDSEEDVVDILIKYNKMIDDELTPN